MKRLIMLAVLCAFVLGGMAYATETRVMTMGDVNNIVKDEANIWLYPSTINYYPNLFIAEYWQDEYLEYYYGYYEHESSDIYNVGAHFQFGQESDNPWILGVYFSSDGYYHDILDTYYYDKEVDHFDNADQRLTLFYGRNISDMPFGFYFSLWGTGYKNEDTVADYNEEESLTRYEFAFGLSPMEKKLDLTLGLAMTTWKDKDVHGDYGLVDETKPSGNMDLGFMARYWMDPMGKYTLVPHFGLYYSKQGIEYYGDDGESWVLGETDESKDMMFELGLGINYDADENVLLVTDFGFMMDNYKYTVDYADADYTDPDEYKDTWTAMPYFKIGLDAYVFKWMDLRCGIAKYWDRETYEPDAESKEIWSWGGTDTYFGAGFNWGKLTLDAEINTNFIGNGPYFVTGDATDGGFADRISLKYAF